MRSMPPTVLMYFAMMSSAVCADSGRAKSASPASLRRVFRMGSPRRDTVFDSGSPKIVVSGASQGTSCPTARGTPGFRYDRVIVGHQLSRSAPPSGGGRSALDGKAACAAQAASGRSRRDGDQVPLSPGDVQVFVFTVMLSRNTNPGPTSVPSSKIIARLVTVPASMSAAWSALNPNTVVSCVVAIYAGEKASLFQPLGASPDWSAWEQPRNTV